MPTCMWCPENFDRIARLWGKVIMKDDRAEESKSFSIARILFDTYQGEAIHEWVSVKIEDRVFEVFVKEFGSEVYSVHSHLDRDEECSGFIEELCSEPGNGEIPAMTSPMNIQRPSETSSNLNLDTISDPIINAIINSKFNEDFLINWRVDEINWKRGEMESRVQAEEIRQMVPLGFDPMIIEAQIGTISPSMGLKQNGEKDTDLGPLGLEDLAHHEGGSETSNFCPFPPGFGPCSIEHHVHRGAMVARDSQSFVQETPIVERESESEESSSQPYEIERADAVSYEEETQSDETLYCLGEQVIRQRACVAERVGQGVCTPSVGLVKAGETVNNEQEVEEESDGFLYRINTNALIDERGSGVGEEGDEGQGDIQGEQGGVDGDDIVGRNGDLGKGKTEDTTTSGERWYGEGLIEASESKQIWARGGIFFDSSEEGEVIAKLLDCKGEGKKKIELRQRKQHQGRRPPCIQGRTLATRTLRGIGGSGKVEMLKQVCRKNCVDFLGVVETKRENFNDNFEDNIWGHRTDIRWEHVESVNSAGGILCVWNTYFFLFLEGSQVG
ncbi:hypothetical protein PIB30_072281 [Stylosanthes scabra]|uniref:DUF4283 domain-containing protein n=1 Tax=Stylosanthes scabra TaxID=79078 RepID=A0ABU6XMX0_9FABA|nr:hypothetical protein [Stylosanthes scabra]